MLAFGLVSLAAGAAGAATCPFPIISGTGYYATVTTPDSSCLAFGDGNLGFAAPDDFQSTAAGAGYVLLDKTDDTSAGIFTVLNPLNPTDFVGGTATHTFLDWRHSRIYVARAWSERWQFG